jgi:hypothetical protein
MNANEKGKWLHETDRYLLIKNKEFVFLNIVQKQMCKMTTQYELTWARYNTYFVNYDVNTKGYDDYLPDLSVTHATVIVNAVWSGLIFIYLKRKHLPILTIEYDQH